MSKKVSDKTSTSSSPASKKDSDAPRVRGTQIEEMRERILELESKVDEIERQRSLIAKILGPVDGSMRTVVIVALFCAAVLGGGAFMLIRGIQWRTALNDLRAEPGIEVMGTRSIGLLGKQVVGLRDPLAANPAEILARHNINPDTVDFQLAEYHSLNTNFGRKREEEGIRQLEELREKLINVVGTISEENRRKRDADLAKISQLLLELRFPEAMDRLQLKNEDGIWFAEGKLEGKEYDDFKVDARKFILSGKLDFENLGNLTDAKISSLITGIESYNLLDKDYDGNFSHVSRIARLIKDYDEVCLEAGLSPRKFKMRLQSKSPDDLRPVASKIAEQLIEEAKLLESRIVPTVAVLSSGDAADRLEIEFLP